MSHTLISSAGNLVRNPEVRQLSDGTVMTRVTVAVNDRRFNKSTNVWEDVNTSYFNITCWRMQAERAGSDLVKGDPVFFSGKLQVKRYQKGDGSWDISCDVEADVLGPDLRRVSVAVKRRQRPVETPEVAQPIAEPIAQPVAEPVAAPAA
jgi:single-strand DNA-binding protein